MKYQRPERIDPLELHDATASTSIHRVSAHDRRASRSFPVAVVIDHEARLRRK
jgi:hypothetical protein